MKTWFVFLGLAFWAVMLSACKSFDTTPSAAADFELKGAYDSNYMLRLAQAEDASGMYLFETCIHTQKAVVAHSCVPTFKDSAHEPVLFTLTTIELPQDLSDQEVEYLQALNQKYDRYHAEVMHADPMVVGFVMLGISLFSVHKLLDNDSSKKQKILRENGRKLRLLGEENGIQYLVDDKAGSFIVRGVNTAPQQYKGLRGLIVYHKGKLAVAAVAAVLVAGALKALGHAEEVPATTPKSFSPESDDMTFIMDLPSDLWSVNSDDNTEVVSVEELIKNMVSFQHKIWSDEGDETDHQAETTIAQYCLPSLNGSQKSVCFSA